MGICMRKSMMINFMRALVLLLCSAVSLLPMAQAQDAKASAAANPPMGGRWFLPQDELGGFVHIPAGTFLMGSNPAQDRLAFENERWSPQLRQGRVDLPDYYIGHFEVTAGQFRAFVEATGYRHDNITDTQDMLPIVNVSWTDALAYCRWLERSLREEAETFPQLRQLLLDGWHISLPNEAQWEKAARGFGSRVYPWGNQPRSDRANYDSTGLRPVGSFECPECAYGLADMSGNVWELTRSPFQPYPFEPSPFDSPRQDPLALDEDPLWVIRGGSYRDKANLVRGAVRGGIEPGVRLDNIGFRLVLEHSE